MTDADYIKQIQIDVLQVEVNAMRPIVDAALIIYGARDLRDGGTAAAGERSLRLEYATMNYIKGARE